MKKSLSVILAVIMVFSVFAVAVSAESSYTVNGSAYIKLPYGYKLDKDNFSVSFDISNDRLLNASGDYGVTFASFDASVVDGSYSYNSNPDSFFEDVNAEAEIEIGLNILSDVAAMSMKYLCVDYEFTVSEGDKPVVGYADYKVTVNGFYKGELTEETSFSSISGTGSKDIVPFEKTTVTSAEVKTSYKDNEAPEIISATAEIEANGDTYTATYAENPALFEVINVAGNVTIDTEELEIAVPCDNATSFKVPVTVDHAWASECSSISKSSHAIVCEGCGEVDSTTVCEHNFDNYVSNDNATFVKDGTKTGTCTECGATETINDEGTAGYVTKFAEYEFLYVIFDYISLIFEVIAMGRIF